MESIEKVNDIFHEQGYKNFKWISGDQVVVSNWVRKRKKGSDTSASPLSINDSTSHPAFPTGFSLLN